MASMDPDDNGAFFWRTISNLTGLFFEGCLSMKKILILAVVLTLVAFGTAIAGIEGTAHDADTAGFSGIAEGGKCSACHIPHGAQGDRLWPSQAVSAPGVYVNDVAVLCGYCPTDLRDARSGSFPLPAAGF